jgi:hypothetical protein
LFQEGLKAGIFTPQRVEELRTAVVKSRPVWEKWVADTQEMVENPQSFKTISHVAQQRILVAGLAFLRAFNIPLQAQQTLAQPLRLQTPIQQSGQQASAQPSREQFQLLQRSQTVAVAKALPSLLRQLEKAGVMSSQQCSQLPDAPATRPEVWEKFVTDMKDLMQNPRKLSATLASSRRQKVLEKLKDFLDAYEIPQPTPQQQSRPQQQSSRSQQQPTSAGPSQQAAQKISLPKDHVKAFLSLYNETLAAKRPLDQEFRDLAIGPHEAGLEPKDLLQLIEQLGNQIEEFRWPEFPVSQEQRARLAEKAQLLLAIYENVAQQHQIRVPSQPLPAAWIQQQSHFRISSQAMNALESLVRYMKIVKMSPGDVFSKYEKGLHGGWKMTLGELIKGLKSDIIHIQKPEPTLLGIPGERTRIADLMTRLLRELEKGLGI